MKIVYFFFILTAYSIFNVEARAIVGYNGKSIFNIYKYHSYEEILNFTFQVAKQNPKVFSVEQIGTTYEGRKLVLLKASKNDWQGRKPIIMVDAAHHAREWAAVASILALVDELRQGKTKLLDYADWYIIPVVNPDGYEYSRNGNRMWRKNRALHRGSDCKGIDLNRNYGFHWGVSGVSKDPCDWELYAGSGPFTENETKAVKSVMQNNAKRIKLYLTLHSFGQYMVYPFGYAKDQLPQQWKKLKLFASLVTREVTKLNGNKYNIMSAGEWYPSAGGSDDYAFGILGIPFVFTVELTNGYEFNYPESKLPKLFPESIAIFKTAAKIKLYLTLHSFGQYMVYPYGYTGDKLPPQWKKLNNFAKTVAGAVEKLNGNKYKVMSAGEWYPSAGGSDDYAFGTLGIPYAYTVELTDGFEFKYPEKKLPILIPESSVIFNTAAQLIASKSRSGEFDNNLKPGY